MGENISYIERIKEKWKEFLVFLCMLGLLLTLTVCKPDRTLDPESFMNDVCFKKDSIIVILGGFVLVTVVSGFLHKKFMNKKTKKIN